MPSSAILHLYLLQTLHGHNPASHGHLAVGLEVGLTLGVLAGFPWHSVIPRAPARHPPLSAFASTVPSLNFTAQFPSVFISCLHSTSHSLKLLLIFWQLFSSCPCSKLTSPKRLVTAISLLQTYTWPRASVTQYLLFNWYHLQPSQSFTFPEKGDFCAHALLSMWPFHPKCLCCLHTARTKFRKLFRRC